jgi:hypothetical protein
MVTRHRVVYALVIAVTVVLGLGSRMKSLDLPHALDANGGDVLSATCIFFGVRLLRPQDRMRRVAVAAFLICVLIELQQLYQANWAVRLRDNRIIGTLLGHGFLWIDIVRYAVGVAFGVGVAVTLERRLASKGGH